MSGWHPNPGFAPVWTSEAPDDVCPPDRVSARQAKDARVYVRLRCGSEPAVPWPLLGSRWSLGMDSHDITHWRRA